MPLNQPDSNGHEYSSCRRAWRDVDDIIKTRTMNAYAFLGRNDGGLYVPAYRRTFDWGKREISRFFDGICHGLEKLPRYEDAVTFLGVVVLLWDRKHEGIQPRLQGHVPPRVFTVIDGQQRLTMLLLSNLILHNQIAVRTHGMVPDTPAGRWIVERKQHVLAKLQATFEIDFMIGDDEHRYYPKMIRAFEDCWSWQAARARYTSSTASLLRSYISHCHQQRQTAVAFKVGESRSAEIRTAWSEIDKHVATMVSEEADHPYDARVPALSTPMLGENLDAIQAFIGSELPKEAWAMFSKKETTKVDKCMLELLRLFTLTQYLLERMALVIVVAHTEEQALDVTESLRKADTSLVAAETSEPQARELSPRWR